MLNGVKTDKKGAENMANTRLIEEYIRDSGYKLRHVARALHISESALHSKLQGRPSSN